MDTLIRRLERKAATGDTYAQAQLDAMNRRLKGWSLIQAFEFEGNNLEAIERMLYVMVPIFFGEIGAYTKLHIKTKAGSWRDGGYGKDKKPRRLFVAQLEDYASHYDDKEDIACQTYQEMVEKTMELLTETPKIDTVPRVDHLIKELGDGYDIDFNHDDGSVGFGYRLHHEPAGGWNKLLVSLTHIYYGK